jgi:hypothetical protein
MKTLLVTLVVLATTLPAHAGAKLPNELVGKYCLDEFGDLEFYEAQKEECPMDRKVELTATEYKGHELSCRFTAVRTWIDPTLRLDTKTMGRPVTLVNARCSDMDCTWPRTFTMNTTHGGMSVLVRGVNTGPPVCKHPTWRG